MDVSLLILVTFISLLAIFIFRRLSNEYTTASSEKPKFKFQYRRKEYFMTKSEHELYDLLVQLFGFRYRIFAQVHLDALFDHEIVGQSWKAALSHVQRKSVDFVICDQDKLSPLLAIELDDSSHQREDRQIRDQEVEAIFRAVQLPLLRIESYSNLDRTQIFHQVTEALKNSSSPSTSPKS